MRTTTWPLLLLPLLFTGCSPIRVTNAAGADDSPIIIADGGGTKGPKGPKNAPGETRTETTTTPVNSSFISHEHSNGHQVQYADGFYVRDSPFQAVCFEMPANPKLGIQTRQTKSLLGHALWQVILDDGMQVLSGNGNGQPYFGNTLISIFTSTVPVIPTPSATVGGTTSTQILDPATALTQAKVILDGTSTFYYPDQPVPPGSGIQFLVHYCKNGSCGNDSNGQAICP
jgi:hypothetical protein